MKVTTLLIRLLLGALMLFSALAYFLNLFPQPELTGGMKTFNEGIQASIYLMPAVKVIELMCGIALIVNRFVPLAIVLIFPIAVNILGVHLFLAPEGLPVALFIMAATIFLAVRNKEHFKPLLSSKV